MEQLLITNSNNCSSTDEFAQQFNVHSTCTTGITVKEEHIPTIIQKLGLVVHKTSWEAKKKEFTPDSYIGDKIYMRISYENLAKKRYIISLLGTQKDAEIFKEIVLNYAFKLKESNNQKISLMRATTNGYELKTADLGKSKKGILDNYPTDFLPFHNHVITKLKKKDSGIILLHGEPGTGKTSYIKYLTSIVKREFVIVPNNLLDQLSSPNMIGFLMSHPELVLILEDAENAVSSRDSGKPNSVASLLNLSDGLIGSAIKCTLIVTFNTALHNIDQALLRKGRLIGEHNFGKLPVIDSNKLLFKLGKNHTTDVPMLLTDIFNFDEEVYKTQKERETIGFRKY